MRKKILAGVVAGMVVAPAAWSDEGMWLPSQLPEIQAQIKAAGYKGDVNALSNVTLPPLSAVAKVGGATGAFVSKDGLVLTNHHVAFGVIQYNSSKERDLIKNGFVAANRDAELPANPDYRVLVTTGFDRITDRILKAANGKTGRDYYEAIDQAGKAEVKICEKDAGYRCSVANMHYGSDFYLIKQLELKDIRLVYAPPEAIGNYGDEVDNFMWPRHSGDFTVLRAYVGKDGKPAAYSKDNVPYSPPAFLQISTTPIKAGDYAMLAGYPGTTYRNRTAGEFADQMRWQLPTRVELYGSILKDIASAAPGGTEAAVKYAAQTQSVKNTLKRAQGELEGMTRSKADDVRMHDEQAMLAWLKKQPNSQASLRDIAAVEKLLADGRASRDADQLFSLMRSQTQVLRAAIQIQRFALEKQKPDELRESGYQQRDEALIEASLKQVQRRYDPGVEKAIMKDLLTRYFALPADQRIAEVNAVFGDNLASAGKTLDTLYATTQLGTEAERLRWMKAEPQAVAASSDAILVAAGKLMPAILANEQKAKEREGELLRLRPAYMSTLAGFRKSQGRAMYPDANSTLRVSFGKVTGMHVRDGMEYTPVTTVKGITEKHTGKFPFDAPEALRKAIAKGDFGSTIDPTLKSQSVNFMTNLDTTGGNSGSPVMDADGKLIGLNFDSNWEAVSASWMYDPQYKRAIHVDLRYMRWLMAKVYPAPWLLKELNVPTE